MPMAFPLSTFPNSPSPSSSPRMRRRRGNSHLSSTCRQIQEVAVRIVVGERQTAEVADRIEVGKRRAPEAAGTIVVV